MGRSSVVQQLLLALLALAACLSRSCNGYPMYYHNRGFANSCTDAPTAEQFPLGAHLPPQPDPTIGFEVKDAGGQPVTSLCPGETYEVDVSFGGGLNRAALLTASGGSFAESNVGGCPNAMTTSGTQRVGTVKANLVLPCTAPSTIELRVTAGTVAVGALRQNTASFPVNSACAASSCPRPPAAAGTGSSSTTTTPTGTSTTPAGSSSSSGVTATQGTSAPSIQQEAGSSSTAQDSSSSSRQNTTGTMPTSTDDPASATVGMLKAGAAQPTCPTSSLGYQCSQKVADGVTIHYSYGGKGQPGNSCTQGATLDSSMGNETSMMHFAIESSQPGWAAIGFPQTPGTMVPSDAVMGSVDPASGAAQVDTYRLSAYMPSGVNSVKPTWATGMGAVRLATPKTTVVCFSRPLAATGVLKSQLDPTAVPLIWATSSSTNKQQQHDLDGSLTVNLQSGRPTDVSADDSYLPLHVRYAAQIAHGVLMVFAFCLFMPAGVVIARHKWLFANKKTGKISAVWFRLHQSLQQAGIITLIASFVLAMALFYRKNGLGGALHQLYTPHFAMGVTVVAAAVLQAVLASVRPAILHQRRAMWRAAHMMLGYSTVGLGLANCFVGVVLCHDLRSMPFPAWLVPMCIVVGAIVLAGLVLEVFKIRLHLKGRYDARTHTLHPGEVGLPKAVDGNTSSAGPSSPSAHTDTAAGDGSVPASDK